MTGTEKEFLSNTVITTLRKVESDSSRLGRRASETTRCVFCGGKISPSEFLLMREGEGFVVGCMHCGAPREMFPSVNPFMFSGFVRNRAN
jgi:hypothetical protein